MHPIIAVVLLSVIACSPAAAARRTGYEGKSIDDVIVDANSFNPNAVKELGRRKNRSTLELLKRIAADPDVPGPPHRTRISEEQSREAVRASWRNIAHVQARIALARMGEGNYFDECVGKISSPDPDRRIESIENLGEIGDKRAVKYLIPILDDQKRPPRHGHVARPQFSEYAEGALEKILPDVGAQVYPKDSHASENVVISRWKDWWTQHHADYENLH